jgi:hypothetical protein
MNVLGGATLRRSLGVLVMATALTVSACTNNTSNAPARALTTPLPSSTSLSPPPQPTVGSWARSMCQGLGFAFFQLGTPPQLDFTDPITTRQALSTYLGNAAKATQQAIDLLSSVGAPPVSDGERVIGQMRTKLTQLRGNLEEMATRLNGANTDDGYAIAQAFAAIGNVLGLFGTLTTDPQLRTAIDETPECHLRSH